MALSHFVFFFFGQCAPENHDEQFTKKTLEMELISKLIKSLRDDEQGKSWEPGAQVLAQSRRERVVAQHFADLRFRDLFPELAGRSLRRMFPLW